jgi:hypothetical protein
MARFLRPGGVRRVLEFAPSAPLSAYPLSCADLQYRTADLMMAGVDDVVDITDMPMYADGSFDLLDRIPSCRVKVLYRR